MNDYFTLPDDLDSQRQNLLHVALVRQVRHALRRKLRKAFEFDKLHNTCLKLADSEYYEMLVWTSSFILLKFVDTSSLDINIIEFLKLNKKPLLRARQWHFIKADEASCNQQITLILRVMIVLRE
jgi:hypothetical protein